MMRVYFKNGTSVGIDTDTAKVLGERIVQGCKQFQVFSADNGELILAINMMEITHISI